VAGQVDGQERAPERQRHRVPRVGVLGPAVDEHDFGRPVAPHEAAHRAPAGEVDLRATDGRRAVPGEPCLFRVLVQHPELVRVHRATIAPCETPPQRAAP
jgi:hypothetical protein